MLLQHPDVDFNTASNGQDTPLLAAAKNGHTKVVAVLLRHPDVDINKVNSKGATLLYVAAENGHKEVVRLLLDHQALHPRDFDAPIKIARDNKFLDIVAMLEKARQLSLPSTRAVRVQDVHATAELLIAAATGNSAAVKLKLRHPGIQINKANSGGLTPLLAAAQTGRANVVDLLVKEWGILVNRPDKSGQTPLHLAASKGHAPVVELLVNRRGILVNRPDKNGHTPLDVAVASNHKEVVRILLDRGAAPLDSASELAGKMGFTEIVEMLTAAKERRERVPLHNA